MRQALGIPIDAPSNKIIPVDFQAELSGYDGLLSAELQRASEPEDVIKKEVCHGR